MHGLLLICGEVEEQKMQKKEIHSTTGKPCAPGEEQKKKECQSVVENVK